MSYPNNPFEQKPSNNPYDNSNNPYVQHPQNFQQQNFMANIYQETPVTVGEWMITIFLTAIPLVGIILLFVWAFGSNTPQSKANWAKANLIFALIGIIIGILFFVLLAGLISRF